LRSSTTTADFTARHRPNQIFNGFSASRRRQSHPDLLPDARRAANALLATVSFRDIAKSVFDALLALDLDDLDAGPRAGGYVEPSEAAWEVIEKVVDI
jgi:hypothetical protein